MLRPSRLRKAGLAGPSPRGPGEGIPRERGSRVPGGRRLWELQKPRLACGRWAGDGGRSGCSRPCAEASRLGLDRPGLGTCSNGPAVVDPAPACLPSRRASGPLLSPREEDAPLRSWPSLENGATPPSARDPPPQGTPFPSSCRTSPGASRAAPVFPGLVPPGWLSRRLSWAGERESVSSFCPENRVGGHQEIPRGQAKFKTHPGERQWRATCSFQSDRYRIFRFGILIPCVAFPSPTLPVTIRLWGRPG